MNITMPRGDIRQVRFSIRNPDDEDSLFNDVDEIYFTVKQSFRTKNAIFQKRLSAGTIETLDDGSYQFQIDPQDTDGISYGKYVFDIEVVRDPDIKQTFIGELEITNEVTFPENEA